MPKSLDLEKAVLCYCHVDENGKWAYFTTGNLKDQTGRGWNVPWYAVNSQPPKEKEGVQIIKVVYGGPFQSACEYSKDYYKYECGLSVNEINNLETGVPWLQTDKINIWAGVGLKEFVRLVHQGGGEVYPPMSILKQLNKYFSE